MAKATAKPATLATAAHVRSSLCPSPSGVVVAVWAMKITSPTSIQCGAARYARSAMPTYEYACKSCDEHIEVVQSFKDDPLTTCPNCGGELRKVFGAIGIAFKGSGFYRNDSRPAPKEAKEAKEKVESGDGAKAKDKAKDKEGKADSKTGASGQPQGAKSDSKSAASS